MNTLYIKRPCCSISGKWNAFHALPHSTGSNLTFRTVHFFSLPSFTKFFAVLFLCAGKSCSLYVSSVGCHSLIALVLQYSLICLPQCRKSPKAYSLLSPVLRRNFPPTIHIFHIYFRLYSAIEFHCFIICCGAILFPKRWDCTGFNGFPFRLVICSLVVLQ